MSDSGLKQYARDPDYHQKST